LNYDLSGGLNQAKYDEFHDPRLEGHKWDFASKRTFSFLSKRFPEPGSMLDIGCGSGRLLYLARKAGWQARGIHLSPEMAMAITRCTGIEIRVADILQYEPGPLEQYDLVVLRHVLEHLPDPHLAIQKIYALVRPGGHALLEFPNIDGIDLRYKRFIRRSGLYRKSYPEGWVPGHCNEYCRESFQYLIDTVGFELLSWRTYSSRPTPISFIQNALGLGNKARAVLRRPPTG